MNELVKKLADRAGFVLWQNEEWSPGDVIDWNSRYDTELETLIKLVVEECIDSIEAYRIPVGNSAAGEIACEWTYDALKEIRDEIKEKFEAKP